MHSGQEGERLAREYLVSLGYRVLATNFRFHHGEIDIVAQDGDVMVFCEVKARWNDAYGPPEAAVTPLKQARIRRVAVAYLAAHQRVEQECRFDVVAIEFHGAKVTMRHCINAF